MHVWMAVSADKYELPIAIADTAKELAEMIGYKEQSVIHAIYRKTTGKKTGIIIYKVEIT